LRNAGAISQLTSIAVNGVICGTTADGLYFFIIIGVYATTSNVSLITYNISDGTQTIMAATALNITNDRVIAT
jgi:hypothetical protein